MKTIAFWYHNARPIALPQSLLPAFTALTAAIGAGSFSWTATLLTIVGVACVHLGMNLADDWFDYKVHSGETRLALAADGIRARIIKYPYLTSGQATAKQLLAAACVFFAVAMACGAILTLMRGMTVVWLAALAFFIGISYSGAPLRLGFRGWGEAVIFVMFGPLLMISAYYVAAGEFSWKIVWLSNAVGLLVTSIIYTHSVMDAEPDKRMGKYTMAHLMGSARAMTVFSGFLNLAPYLLVAAGVLLGQLHVAYMAVWLVLPLSIWLTKSLGDFAFGRQTEIEPRLWAAPKSDFEKYRKAGVDWFMLRWLTARNIVMFFCLIVIVVSIVLPHACPR